MIFVPTRQTPNSATSAKNCCLHFIQIKLAKLAFSFLKWNLPKVTQDSFIALKMFAILISIYISIKTHQFVCSE